MKQKLTSLAWLVIGLAYGYLIHVSNETPNRDDDYLVFALMFVAALILIYRGLKKVKDG